jgi:hypothetical protein
VVHSLIPEKTVGADLSCTPPIDRPGSHPRISRTHHLDDFSGPNNCPKRDLCHIPVKGQRLCMHTGGLSEKEGELVIEFRIVRDDLEILNRPNHYMETDPF